MTGVDILAMEEVAVEWTFNWTAFWIVFAMVSIGGLVYSVYPVAKGDYPWPLIPALTLCFMAFGAGFGALTARSLETPTKYAPQYKVTISDEVSMNDFLEKYEIIETEGKIYTVREKGE